MGDMTEFNKRLLVMTAGGVNPNVMINALSAQFPDIHVSWKSRKANRPF